MIHEKLPKIITALPGEKSRQLGERKRKYVSDAISVSCDVFVQEARDAMIKDVDGNVFLDVAAAIGVQNSGHCDEAVVEAAKSQLENYIHPCFQVLPYEPYVELAGRLSEAAPIVGTPKAMFANSGAEAVENAVKIARRYTKKQGIISLETAFHGRTYMTMGLTSKVKPYKNGMGPFPGETYKIPSPYCYRCPMCSTYPECGLACVERFDKLLKTELAVDNIAAVIAEPVQGEGGFIVPPKDYFKALKQVCQKHDILLIADEIQSGFARTGKLFAIENFDIQPDLMTLSKSIAAGLPLSAVVGRAEIMDAPGKGEIGGTYGGSPVACVAAVKVLDKIEKEKLSDRATAIGTIMKDRLNDMKEKYSVIGDIRGLGAMVGAEFVKDRATKEPYKEIVGQIVKYCYQKGVILLSAGILGNVVRFLPPLVMTDEQMSFVMDTVEEAIDQITK